MGFAGFRVPGLGYRIWGLEFKEARLRAARSGGAENPISIAKRVFAKHPVICWCSLSQKALVAASKCRGCLEGGPHNCAYLTTLSGHYKQNKVKLLFHLVHDSCTEAEAIVKYLRQKKVVVQARVFLEREETLRPNKTSKPRSCACFKARFRGVGGCLCRAWVLR